MKIVWVCNFSNAEIRSRIKKNNNPLEPFVLKLFHREKEQECDIGVWITNAIDEIRDRKDIELHVITPIRDLKDDKQEEEMDVICYHFIRDENSGLARKVIRFLFTKNNCLFKKNRSKICRIINDISPDLVHVIGAENPFYSLSLLDIPKQIPTFLQLQALLCSVTNKVSDDSMAKNFAYKAEIEKELIRRADYIGTRVPSFIQYIRNNIKADAVILNTTLAMGQQINMEECQKKYTFIHFASGLSESKATDTAIEAFCIAHERFPDITLDVVGSYSVEFKRKIDELLDKYQAQESVKFEGRLPTHDDVIMQIRSSSYALLPLKIDIIPNTIHEAMANGLPVVTTETEGGTPKLNNNRKSVLLSPIGDSQSLANNMIMLLENPGLAEELRQNGAITEKEYWNNKDVVNHWLEVYEAIVRHSKFGDDIPKEFFS